MNPEENLQNLESNAPEGGCYEYVAYRLGYTETEAIYIFSDYSNFEVTQNIEDADFLEIFRERFNGEYYRSHIVFIDHTENGILLSERPNVDFKIRYTTLEALNVTYPLTDKFKYVYFKKRTTK